MRNITPPPELVEQWISELDRPDDPRWQEYEQDIADRAAQWGADQELKASVSWLVENQNPRWADALYVARRPKPSSLKEQALGALSRADKDALTNPLTGDAVALRTILNQDQAAIIRRALEALSDD